MLPPSFKYKVVGSLLQHPDSRVNQQKAWAIGVRIQSFSDGRVHWSPQFQIKNKKPRPQGEGGRGLIYEVKTAVLYR